MFTIAERDQNIFWIRRWLSQHYWCSASLPGIKSSSWHAISVCCDASSWLYPYWFEFFHVFNVSEPKLSFGRKPWEGQRGSMWSCGCVLTKQEMPCIPTKSHACMSTPWSPGNVYAAVMQRRRASYLKDKMEFVTYCQELIIFWSSERHSDKVASVCVCTVSIFRRL
jgi:hypothetical protein